MIKVFGGLFWQDKGGGNFKFFFKKKKEPRTDFGLQEAQMWKFAVELTKRKLWRSVWDRGET